MGASGGRRIFPAVMQLISFLVDYRMSVDQAIHQPRIDVSGTDSVTLDAALADYAETLGQQFKTRTAYHGVQPALFACPNLIGRDRNTKLNSGAAYVTSPWAAVCAE